MIVLIDNYDSFTFNLYHLIAKIYNPICVIRNDEKSVAEILKMKPRAIVLSPGPGRPENAGILIELIQKNTQIPMLGVCLGMQAIAQAFCGQVVFANSCEHGKAHLVLHDGEALFQKVKNPFKAARYHSLMVEEKKLPSSLRITARTEEGTPMAISHQKWPLWGVQFHPESILSECGHEIIENFLKMASML